MGIEGAERLHEREGIKLAAEPSVFTAPRPMLEYFLSVLAGGQPSAPLAPTGEWWQLVNLTYPHKLIPLFYRTAEQLPEYCQPPELVMRHLKRLYVESRLRGLMMETQLQEALAAMTAAGAEPLVLKGLALAYGYYPDHASRSSTDIDLLVRPDQYPAAKRALLGLGYHDLGDRFETLPHLANESSFINGRSDYRIDLHWSMHPFNRVDRERETEELTQRAVMVGHDRLRFLTLSPADEFIQSARHLTWNHLDSVRLVWVWDLMLVARRIEKEKAWPTVLELASRLHAGAAVWQSLELVRAWTGLSPAAPFDRRETWPVDDAFEQALWNRLRRSRGGSLGRLWLAWNPNWPLGRKLDFWRRLLFPPAALMRKNYPPARPWLLPLSYLKRFFRAANRIAALL